MTALWIILTGATVAVACALVGTFLVLRKISMLGDAISHAVLPGIAIAYILAGGRNAFFVFVGAVIFGVLTTFIVQFLSNAGIQGDASIGVAFTFLFALGVVLISLYGDGAHIDLDHVLYGEIAYAPFDMVMVGDLPLGPRAMWVNAILILFNGLTIGLLFKQFKICSFDPATASSLGIPVNLMHYLLMFLVSVTCVGAFESVGAILVVAMLIVPPATAYLLTDDLKAMLFTSFVIGIASSITGYYFARAFDVSIAGAMALMSGCLFAAAFLFSPKYGYVSKRLHQARLSERERQEDILLALWRFAEAGLKDIDVHALEVELKWGAGQLRSSLRRLAQKGLLKVGSGQFELSEEGARQTKALIRRHRLFESYLEKHGVRPDHVHLSADRGEHYIQPETTERIDKVLGERLEDPHGRVIPRKQ